MNDGKKTKKELLGEVEELRRRLAAAEQDCQILVNGLRGEHRLAEARWRQRVEDLETKLTRYAAQDKPPLSEAEDCDSERKRLLARVQEQTEELQAANEELNLQTEELQAANEELTIQAEELRVANEELITLNGILEGQKQELERLARELETEHAMLTAVLQQMPASVVIVKAPAGPILMSNKHAEHLFRQPQGMPADLESFWRIERYTPDGQLCEKEDQPLWRSLHLGEAVLDEELSLRPEGRSSIHVSVSAAPVRDSQGRIVAGVATHFDITARKRAEETLRASEARYRNLVQLSPDAIIVHTEGKIVFLNMAAVQLLDASRPADILGRHILDLVHPDSRKLGAQRIKMAQAGGTTAPEEIQLVRLDGTVVDVETVGSGIMYQGQPAIQVIIRDVTTRKKAEAERERLLAERDRTATQLEAVLNSMSEGLIISDPEGNILAMNHAALALWGFESIDEVKRHLSEFPKFMDVRELSGEVVPWEEWPMAWALRGETFTNRELRLRRGDDGEEFICSYCGGPVLDKNGRAILGVITIHDITARKQAEEALRQRESQLQTILENLTEGLVVADLDGRLFHWNMAAVAMHGFSSLAEAQRHLPEFADTFELSTADDGILPLEQWPLARILRGETLRDWEVDIRRKHNGWQRVFSYGGTLARDPEGQPLMAVVSVSDITEQKAANKALRESREDLNRAQAVAQIGSWRMDVQKNELTWSEENHRIFEIPPGNPLTYETFLAAVHPEDRKYVDRKWTAALGGEPYDIEHRVIADGKIKWVRERAELEFDSQGRLLGAFGTTQDITERKQAEAAIIQAKEEWERTFDAVPDSIAILDQEHKITRINRAMSELLGVGHEEVIGQPCYKAVHGLDMAPDFCPHARLMATGQPYAIEVQEFGRIFAVSVSPIFGPEGQITGGVHVARDITESKQAEEALRASEERERARAGELQAVLDAVPAFIWIAHDPDSRMITGNLAAYELLRLPSGENMSKTAPDGELPTHFRVMQGSQDIPFQELPVQRAACGQTIQDMELDVVHDDGITYNLLGNAVPLLDSAGQPRGAVAAFIDLTARKQAEEALKESEERYRSIFENSHAVMLLLDPKTGALVDANPAACSYYGYSREELQAKKVTDLNTLPPEQVFAKMRMARERQQEHFYFQHRLANGEVRDVEVFSGSIRIKQQNLLFSIVHDITARKQAEEALRRARDELEQRVLERTTELRDTVAQLLEEVQERQQAQESLRKQAELLELAHEAIIVRDLDSRVIFWNRGAEEKYAWTREQALGRVSHELLETRFPTSREEVERELLQTGHWEGELLHIRANGEEIIVSSRQALQRDEQGRPVAILEINRNVTTRRKVEEALKTERQRLLSLLERIPAYVSLLKEDRTFAYVNAEFIRRFGEPGTKHCYELKGLQNPCEECEAVAVFHSGKPLVRERVGHDGSFYQVHNYPFMDVDGSPLVLEMGVDVTPRKRAEEQALSLGRMYRMLSEVNEAVVRIGGDKERLFRQVCRIMMEEGDFLLSWIGLVNWETRLIEAATQYNLDDDYLQNLTIPIDDVPEGRGPAGTAVREDRFDICNDYANDPRMAPWREPALARGFRSSGAFPLRVGSKIVGILNVYSDRPGFFNTAEIDLLESLAENLSYALDFMDKDAKRRRAEEALRESEERLRYLASQLLHTQENERRRLALELHDDLGQSLMVLKLQLRAIERMVPQDQWQFREECTHCLNYLNGVIDNVRRLSRDLRPAVLEDLGLSSGLRVLAGDFCEYHEVELSLEIDDIEGLFSPDEEINIYRIFQETLTNIAKHAAAQQIRLVISRRNNQVNFQVVDNGVGFDLDQVLARDPAKKGLGLAALEERVRMLGGKLTIKSQKHQGTEIYFSVPISGNRITA